MQLKPVHFGEMSENIHQPREEYSWFLKLQRIVFLFNILEMCLELNPSQSLMKMHPWIIF